MIVKRKRLSLAEKNHILDEVETGQVKKVAIARKWGIADRTLRVIVNQKEKWRKAYVEGRSETIYSTRTTPFPQLDSELMAWMGMAMQLGLPITYNVLSSKALCIRDDMLKNNEISEFERDVLARFTASKGWMIRFCKRNHLKPVKMSRPEIDLDYSPQAAIKSVHAGTEKLKRELGPGQGHVENGVCYNFFAGLGCEHEDLHMGSSYNIPVFRQNGGVRFDGNCEMSSANDGAKDARFAQFPLYHELAGPLGELEEKLLPVGDAEVNSLLQKLRRTIMEKQGGIVEVG